MGVEESEEERGWREDGEDAGSKGDRGRDSWADIQRRRRDRRTTRTLRGFGSVPSGGNPIVTWEAVMLS